jgi:hypothetical protein
MTLDDIKFADCELACANCGNYGLSSKEAIDMIKEYVLAISRDSAQKQISCYLLLPLNAALGVLKKTTQKVQATTSNRANINVGQQ